MSFKCVLKFGLWLYLIRECTVQVLWGIVQKIAVLHTNYHCLRPVPFESHQNIQQDAINIVPSYDFPIEDLCIHNPRLLGGG